MDRDKSIIQGGGGGGSSSGLPPHSLRYAAPSPSSSSHPSLDSDHFGHSAQPDAGKYSHDVSRMPDFPTKNPGHRRAHSEILCLPEDLNFDTDLGVVDCHDGPLLSDENENDEELFSMFMDVEKLNSSCATSLGLMEGESSGMVEASPTPATASAAGSLQIENLGAISNERPRARHQHSQSMDGSTSIKPELLGSSGEGTSLVETKKAISAAKLADLALVDPKRAKRIWANRQSAARSKERKMRYIGELERKLQILQTEATTLSAQLTLLQRDTTGLTAENSELKLHLQTMEQQVHLQDALNDALREEVQQLKIATGQMANGGAMNFGPHSFGASQKIYHQNQAMQSLLAAQQLQQLQIQPQQQQLQIQPQQQLHQVNAHQRHLQELLHPQKQQQAGTTANLRMKAPLTSQSQRVEAEPEINVTYKD
ncbi:transcription factor RF2a-like [Typha latifolia]|uniref:transcription factor RF2a-like n=1 Tax=Typha latifolia TaxID=4733 RepID=UPI003C2BE7EF